MNGGGRGGGGGRRKERTIDLRERGEDFFSFQFESSRSKHDPNVFGEIFRIFLYKSLFEYIRVVSFLNNFKSFF